MTSIGRRCRDGDVHSRAILITRTLSAASASLLVRVAEEKETNPQLPQPGLKLSALSAGAIKVTAANTG